LRARSKPKKKKSFQLRLFLFILFFMVAGVAGYYFLSLPLWKIEEVSVDGAHLLSADEIRDLSGIPLSDNLFFADLRRARATLKKISAIKDFHIYRIPPATILIKIKERTPLAVIVLKDRSAIIDDEGYILNRNANLTFNVNNLSDLPVVSGLGSDEVWQDERITPPAAEVLTNIISELSKIFGSRRTHLDLGGFHNISFLLDDLLSVKLGRPEEIDRKMAIFKNFLPVIEGKWDQVEYVDVRFPENPVIKFK
jgi:cell division protein FtsQ